MAYKCLGVHVQHRGVAELDEHTYRYSLLSADARSHCSSSHCNGRSWLSHGQHQRGKRSRKDSADHDAVLAGSVENGYDG